VAKKTLTNSQPETLPVVAPANTVALTPTAAQTPYVVFASRKSAKWDDVKAADPTVNEGDPVLMRPEPLTPFKLAPFEFILIHGEHLWTINESAPPYRALEVSFTEQKDYAAGWCEAYEALVLVRVGKGYVPARVSAHRAQCAGFKIAAGCLQPMSEGGPPLIMSDEWYRRSPAHKDTEKIAMLQARYINIAKPTSGTTRSGKNAGSVWRGMKSSQSPLTVEEAEQVVAATKTPAFEAVSAAYEKRVAELKAMVK
jgi:hypothetical protein